MSFCYFLQRNCGQSNTRTCGRDDAGKENITAAGPEPPVNLQDDASMETENDLLEKTQTQSPSPVPEVTAIICDVL